MNERAADLGEDTPSLISSGHPYLRRLGILTICVAVLSALYHITAVYLLPLPAEQHPNMHLLLAFVIILLGGFASRPDEIGAAVERLRALPILYFLSLVAAVFFFYFITVLGEEWRDRSVRWVYAIPFAVWALMMIQERQWGALGLWLLSMVPSLFLFVFWGSLPYNVQAPQSWWLLLAVSVPVGWVLFEVFYRPGEGLRRAAVPLAALFASLGLAAWRILLWANQADGTRLIGYLWPLLPLAALIFWSKREMHRRWAGFPRHRLPASMDLGVNAGLLALGVGACIYLFYSHDTMSERVGTPNFTDTRAGFMLIFLVSELCRRSFGPPLPVLAVIAILYGLWGNLLPDPFDHGGSGWIELVAKLSTDFIGGVLGFLVVISATFIIMFLILGTFLQESGAGKFFVQFALGLFGRLRAGAALSAVGASALMGTVSGSAAGNVITTGTFTIPLMKRIGISPHIAAAAEAAASSGGQIMPPVMGAGAFIMSELIEVPYIKLIAYAAIPAVLYFLTVGINIQLAAGILDLKPLPRDEVPDWKVELRGGWFYLVPLAFLVYFLVEGRTPVFAGVMAIFIMVAIWLYRRAAEFLARLRVGDRILPDDLWVFVPISFWLYLVIVYSLVLALEDWAGLPVPLEAPAAAGAALVSALALGAVGAALGYPFIRLAGGRPMLGEVERGWLVIYPAGAAIMLWIFGWNAGTAGLCILLAALGLWAVRRGYGLRPISVIPWIFAAIWAAAFGLQYGLYQSFPALYEVAEYLRPFGFLYHSAILFAFAALIQRAILAAAPPRSPEGADRPGVWEVAAISCNPLLYLRRAGRQGRRGPDVEAARGAAGWLDDIRRALEAGGRQGAEFAVTLATIEIVVQVLSITGVGNKFAFMVETL
ncbi:MAG: TRAP transporter fused permease subunit, partial [Candidatus Tectomicrobia bacterium]|nr:TRAP transporter fused permease subunit [Candidatus Tectomicrobia bacterium]